MADWAADCDAPAPEGLKYEVHQWWFPGLKACDFLLTKLEKSFVQEGQFVFEFEFFLKIACCINV